MPSSPIIMRYLLAAQSASATSVPASATANVGLGSAIVPLSGAWTIRLRRVSGLVFPADASGQLQLQTVRVFWQWLNQAGSPVYSIDLINGFLAPYYTFAKNAFNPVPFTGEANQVASSFDQGGANVISGIQAQTFITVLNLDATNPHSVTLQLNAILEFEQPGQLGE